jgi:hypothetical protein
VAAAVVATSIALNGLYQVVRKPSELFFPVSDVLRKSPAETWDAYASLFRRHSTDLITPDLLAALAQVEGAGNPVARTYWRWSLDLNPFNVYQPASSSVGMYQISDGTFEQARRYCIRNHEVVASGVWNDWESCWFNVLYTRVVPSHAIELTAAHLDRSVEQALRRHPVPNATLQKKQKLAALIHLCGAGAGRAHARRGLVLDSGQRCGTHDVRRYLEKVAAQQAQFRAFAAAAGVPLTDATQITPMFPIAVSVGDSATRPPFSCGTADAETIASNPLPTDRGTASRSISVAAVRNFSRALVYSIRPTKGRAPLDQPTGSSMTNRAPSGGKDS